MTVKELLNVYDGKKYIPKLQIVIKNGEWGDYDTLCSDSSMIDFIEDKNIIMAAAVREDVIRIEIEWD